MISWGADHMIARCAIVIVMLLAFRPAVAESLNANAARRFARRRANHGARSSRAFAFGLNRDILRESHQRKVALFDIANVSDPGFGIAPGALGHHRSFPCVPLW